MSNLVTITLTGELICEYLENGMKCHCYYIKLSNGQLISLDILEYMYFDNDHNVTGYEITSPSGRKKLGSSREVTEYVHELIRNMGYTITINNKEKE